LRAARAKKAGELDSLLTSGDTWTIP
jgi:hypothetical protein